MDFYDFCQNVQFISFYCLLLQNETSILFFMKNVLEIRGLNHAYGHVQVLRNINLSVIRGEFVSVLGSSGSGKSTLLRIIAGLELPTSVESLELEGLDVSHVPANHRNVSTVFQHYGLFPHLSVGKNVEYGLKVRKIPSWERRHTAEKLLNKVKLNGFYTRGVDQLSGGQKQRVALARSLVLEPSILLLDEPLGALDEKLRIDMQVELLALQKELGMTFIYVTHSQEEALTMSDRILLMDQGEIIQEDTPVGLFDRPCNRFAAEFMGIENTIPAKVESCDKGYVTAVANETQLRGHWSGEEAPQPGDAVIVAFRAEKAVPFNEAQQDNNDSNQVSGTMLSRIYKGKYLDVSMSTDIGNITMRLWDDQIKLSKVSQIQWKTRHTIMLPAH